jgi:sugar phosphate permease
MVWLIVRVKPADKGLLPDGDLAVRLDENADAAGPPNGMAFREAMATPIFWAFALVDLCVFWALIVVYQQFILYLQSPAIGMTKEAAAAGLATMSLSGIGGKFAFGWLSDRLPRRLVFVVCCGLLFLAALVLFSLTITTAWFFMVPFGLAGGGIFVCAKLVTIELFGLRDAGKIMGTLTVVETAGSATGLAITGLIASRYAGDYTIAFYPVIAVTLVAFLASFFVNRMQTRVSLANSN